MISKGRGVARLREGYSCGCHSILCGWVLQVAFLLPVSFYSVLESPIFVANPVRHVPFFPWLTVGAWAAVVTTPDITIHEFVWFHLSVTFEHDAHFVEGRVAFHLSPLLPVTWTDVSIVMITCTLIEAWRRIPIRREANERFSLFILIFPHILWILPIDETH